MSPSPFTKSSQWHRGTLRRYSHHHCHHCHHLRHYHHHDCHHNRYIWRGDAVITLAGFDADGDELHANVLDLPLPDKGVLYQLSHVFSTHGENGQIPPTCHHTPHPFHLQPGYEPKQGVAMTSGSMISDTANRVYYSRKSNIGDVEQVGAWARFNYSVSESLSNCRSDGTCGAPEVTTSKAGTVTLVPPSGVLVGSDFTTDNEGWTVVGSKAASSPVKWHAGSSRDKLGILTQYISASAESEGSLWFFQAPGKYHGNHGIAYGGLLTFTLKGTCDEHAVSKHIKPIPPFLERHQHSFRQATLNPLPLYSANTQRSSATSRRQTDKLGAG